MEVKGFESYNESNKKDIVLSDKEREFLWVKMEVTKKAKATESKNEVYNILKNSGALETEDQFIKILNSLEYSMKKRIKDTESKAPKGKYEEAFNSLQSKLPKSWLGVKFSVISKHKKDS